MLAVVLLLLVSSCLVPQSLSFYDNEGEAQVVRTEFGRIEGEVFSLINSEKVSVFRGIRYARQPQRFKAPEFPIPWENVFISKKQPMCIQTHIYSDKQLEIDREEREDCLFLRIIAPFVQQNSSYPVMVWLHGGEFQWGSVNRYGIRKAAERLIPHGVILVSPQYRLGLYGFMSTGDNEAPGNYGLLDIKFALEWIQRNIKNFGGDPTKVTIVGEDAGATAAYLLSISPQTRDLFQRAILMSSSVGESNGLSDSAIKATKQLADSLGCPETSNSRKIVECLSQKTPAELQSGYYNIKSLSLKSRLDFQPCQDTFLFPKPLETLLNESPPKQIIIGSAYRDMGTYVWPNNPLISNSFCSIRNESDFTNEHFLDAIEQLIPNNTYQKADILRAIAYHTYVTSRIDPTNITLLIDEYAQLLSDYIVHIPLWLNAKKFVENGWKVWLYSFSHFNFESFPPGQKRTGAFRGGELPYLFDPSDMVSFMPNEKDDRMTDILTRLWSNLAKNGDPNDQLSIHWEPMTNRHLFKFLLLKSKPKMRDNFHRQSIQFWTDLVKKLETSNQQCSQANEAHEEL